MVWNLTSIFTHMNYDFGMRVNYTTYVDDTHRPVLWMVNNTARLVCLVCIYAEYISWDRDHFCAMCRLHDFADFLFWGENPDHNLCVLHLCHKLRWNSQFPYCTFHRNQVIFETKVNAMRKVRGHFVLEILVGHSFRSFGLIIAIPLHQFEFT